MDRNLIRRDSKSTFVGQSTVALDVLPAAPDTKQAQRVKGASKCAIAGFAVLHGFKAAFAQGVAFGIVIGARLAGRELLEAAKNSSEEDLATAAALTGVAITTFVVDQLVTRRATSMMFGWLRNKCNDGAPAQPVGSMTGTALAAIPTALSGALLAREVYGTPESSVLALDLASMMCGWRVARVARDAIQQGAACFLPRLVIVDPKTGQPLTHEQKKSFDDTRLGYQMAGYTAAVFTGAYVATPALRQKFGDSERVAEIAVRARSMVGPMINSMGVEFFDDFFSPIVQSVVASRLEFVVQVEPGKRPANIVKTVLDHGAMRAFMGVFVTDLAQLMASINRGSDIFKSLGTAVGSVATSIMEMRAKTVGVQSGVRDKALSDKDAFRKISNQLIVLAEGVFGREFLRAERITLRYAIKEGLSEFLCSRR